MTAMAPPGIKAHHCVRLSRKTTRKGNPIEKRTRDPMILPSTRSEKRVIKEMTNMTQAGMSAHRFFCGAMTKAARNGSAMLARSGVADADPNPPISPSRIVIDNPPVTQAGTSHPQFCTPLTSHVVRNKRLAPAKMNFQIPSGISAK